MGHFRRSLYVLVAACFLSAVAYMIYYIILDVSPLFPVNEVMEISEWTYEDQLEGAKTVKTPDRVDKKNRDVFIFRSVMPEELPDGAVIAFLLRSNFRLEIGDRVVKVWNKDDAPIIGGPAIHTLSFLWKRTMPGKIYASGLKMPAMAGACTARYWGINMMLSVIWKWKTEFFCLLWPFLF